MNAERLENLKQATGKRFKELTVYAVSDDGMAARIVYNDDEKLELSCAETIYLVEGLLEALKVSHCEMVLRGMNRG